MTPNGQWKRYQAVRLMNKNAEQMKENFLHHLETEKRFSTNTILSYRKDLESLEKYCLDQKITAWRNLKTHHIRIYAAKIFQPWF